MRYYVTMGGDPKEVECSVFIQGPQDSSQLPNQVWNLLQVPGISRVDVRYNHGMGERIDIYRKMEDKDNG